MNPRRCHTPSGVDCPAVYFVSKEQHCNLHLRCSMGRDAARTGGSMCRDRGRTPCRRSRGLCRSSRLHHKRDTVSSGPAGETTWWKYSCLRSSQTKVPTLMSESQGRPCSPLCCDVAESPVVRTAVSTAACSRSSSQPKTPTVCPPSLSLVSVLSLSFTLLGRPRSSTRQTIHQYVQERPPCTCAVV